MPRTTPEDIIARHPILVPLVVAALPDDAPGKSAAEIFRAVEASTLPVVRTVLLALARTGVAATQTEFRRRGGETRLYRRAAADQLRLALDPAETAP